MFLLSRSHLPVHGLPFDDTCVLDLVRGLSCLRVYGLPFDGTCVLDFVHALSSLSLFLYLLCFSLAGILELKRPGTATFFMSLLLECRDISVT